MNPWTIICWSYTFVSHNPEFLLVHFANDVHPINVININLSVNVLIGAVSNYVTNGYWFVEKSPQSQNLCLRSTLNCDPFDSFSMWKLSCCLIKAVMCTLLATYWFSRSRVVIALEKTLLVGFHAYTSLPLVVNNSPNQKYVALTKAVMGRLPTPFNTKLMHLTRFVVICLCWYPLSTAWAHYSLGISSSQSVCISPCWRIRL